MKTYKNHYGIDISKETFDIVDKSGKHLQYSNTSKGFSKFKRTITKDSLCLMEVTGIYHLQLANFLYADINFSWVFTLANTIDGLIGLAI